MNHNTPTIKRKLTFQEIWVCKSCETEAPSHVFYKAHQRRHGFNDPNHIYSCPNDDCRVFMPSTWESLKIHVRLTMPWPTYHPMQ